MRFFEYLSKLECDAHSCGKLARTKSDCATHTSDKQRNEIGPLFRPYRTANAHFISTLYARVDPVIGNEDKQPARLMPPLHYPTRHTCCTVAFNLSAAVPVVNSNFNKASFLLYFYGERPISAPDSAKITHFPFYLEFVNSRKHLRHINKPIKRS